jgi:hypothetical protein
MMVTSGGYQRSTARIIADSILNLRALGLISCEEAANAPPPPGEQFQDQLPCLLLLSVRRQHQFLRSVDAMNWTVARPPQFSLGVVQVVVCCGVLKQM